MRDQTQESTQNPVGEAYAFFDCSATPEDIEGELPHIRERFETPRGLELSLLPVGEFVRGKIDPKLLKIINEEETGPTYSGKVEPSRRTVTPARLRDLKYALHARYPGKTNEDAGAALVGVVNGLNYAFGDGQVFMGEIVGKNPDAEYAVWGEE